MPRHATQINLRVEENLVRDLDVLADYEHINRTNLVRRILSEGVTRCKREWALQLYRQGQVTKSRAAELAGISLWEMMDLIDQADMPADYRMEDALDEIRSLLERVGLLSKEPQMPSAMPSAQLV